MPSFDIVSNFNVQELDNAINITSREVMTRYDLKDQNCSIKFNKNDKNILVEAANEMGCHSIRVNLNGSTENVESWKFSSKESLANLCDYALNYNINVIVENHGGFSSDADLLMNVITDVNRSNCGTLPDFGNFCISNEWGAASEGCSNEYDKYLQETKDEWDNKYNDIKVKKEEVDACNHMCEILKPHLSSNKFGLISYILDTFCVHTYCLEWGFLTPLMCEHGGKKHLTRHGGQEKGEYLKKELRTSRNKVGLPPKEQPTKAERQQKQSTHRQ